MGDWGNLPSELLTLLYTYLPRRDRLACSMVCENWRAAMDCVTLWKTITVRVDKDFSEPSTILLIRDYAKHVRNLELGWSTPFRLKYMEAAQHQNVVKRTVRFLFVLFDCFVLIESLKMFNWRYFKPYGKIIYHLCRFLSEQYFLRKIIFDNITMSSDHYVSIISSCFETSGQNITHVTFRRCKYSTLLLDEMYLRTCFEHFCNVRTLEVDYYIMSCNLIDAIVASGNRNLENLILTVKEVARSNYIIKDDQWATLYSLCPGLKVTLIIQNIASYDKIRIYLEDGIPLVSFVFDFPKKLEPFQSFNFNKTINLLVSNYHVTLTEINLSLQNKSESVDEVLLMMMRRCKNLKRLLFQGIIERPQLIKDKIKLADVLCFWMDKYVEESGRKIFVVRQIGYENLTHVKNKPAQLTLIDCQNYKLCTMLLLPTLLTNRSLQN